MGRGMPRRYIDFKTAIAGATAAVRKNKGRGVASRALKEKHQEKEMDLLSTDPLCIRLRRNVIVPRFHFEPGTSVCPPAELVELTF